MKQIIFLFVFSLRVFVFFAQPADSTILFEKRKLWLGIGAATTAAVGTTGLYYAWYKDYNSGSFHFFNDNSEWLQMDKIGHTLTTYQIGNAGYHACKWSGMSENKSTLIGGTSGLAYMTIIEGLDGFSEGWGFSWGDMGANTAGTLLFIGQQHFWKEQRIKFKFSFHQSGYWQYRPNLLGENLAQQFLKDYNGQSYWLSCNISSFLKKDNKFPKWLNVAVGYGADGMISGKDDYVILRSDGEVIGNQRYRKLLLSLDIDLARIKTRSKVLKAVFKTINFIKIPCPALELSRNKVNGHLFYF
jgi:uncharacterized protein YfiM (DUF2279 family)